MRLNESYIDHYNYKYKMVRVMPIYMKGKDYNISSVGPSSTENRLGFSHMTKGLKTLEFILHRQYINLFIFRVVSERFLCVTLR